MVCRVTQATEDRELSLVPREVSLATRVDRGTKEKTGEEGGVGCLCGQQYVLQIKIKYNNVYHSPCVSTEVKIVCTEPTQQSR